MDNKKFVKFLSNHTGEITLVIMSISLSTIFILKDGTKMLGSLDEKQNPLIIVGLAILFGAISILLPKITNYIEEGRKGTRKTEDWPSLSKLTKDIQSLTGRINHLNLELNESVEETIDEQTIEIDKEQKKINIIIEQTQSIQNALSIQIDKISRSGNVNLTIGLSLTVIAIVMLILVVYADDAPAYLFDETTNSGMRFFIHMIPRLSIVLFIEIFSFFFLNLYKRNVDEIKYFNNERTNLESKIIAIKMAVIFGEKDIIKETIESFHKTERNAIIKKGETTLEIEKLRIESNGKGEIIDKILSLSKVFKPKD